jgi:hypothetical protein
MRNITAAAVAGEHNSSLDVTPVHTSYGGDMAPTQMEKA